MKGQVLLHIGYPKTATTWFQENFFPKVENKEYLTSSLYRSKLITGLFDYDKLRLLFNQYSEVILSDEEFVNIRKDGFYKQMPKRLYQVFGNTAVIIVFIRNPITLLEAKYSTYAKCGGTFTFKELINHILNENKINQWRYYSHLFPYFELFGDNVYIYLYEDFVQNPKRFIDKLKREHNLLVTQKINLKTKKNASYNKTILKMARFTNQFSKTQIGYNRKEPYYFDIPYFHQISHIVYGGLNAVMPYRRFQMSEHLDKQTCEDLYNYFKEDNKLLMDTFHLPLDKYGYPL